MLLAHGNGFHLCIWFAQAESNQYNLTNILCDVAILFVVVAGDSLCKHFFLPVCNKKTKNLLIEAFLFFSFCTTLPLILGFLCWGLESLKFSTHKHAMNCGTSACNAICAVVHTTFDYTRRWNDNGARLCYDNGARLCSCWKVQHGLQIEMKECTHRH